MQVNRVFECTFRDKSRYSRVYCIGYLCAFMSPRYGNKTVMRNSIENKRINETSTFQYTYYAICGLIRHQFN